MQFDFIKGHMGGNEIVLLYGDQIPNGREVEIALRILHPTSLSGHQVGILYPPERGGNLQVKIVGLATRGFISACGGLTQVLGKAALETKLREQFDLPVQEPSVKLQLETQAGMTEVTIDVEDGKAVRVHTDLSAFVKECCDRGVAPLEILETSAMQVGKFLVLRSDDAKATFPEANFEDMDASTKEILLGLQLDFKRRTRPENLDFALYDWHPCREGDARAVFPNNIATGHIEPACGTGTVAIGIAMWDRGELEQKKRLDGNRVRVQFETGGGPELGGPEVTTLDLLFKEENISQAMISHSSVSMVAEGKVWI